MTLQAFIWRDNPESLIIGTCLSKDDSADLWYEYAARLIPQVFAKADTLVVVDVVGLDYYAKLCTEYGIPFDRVTLRRFPLLGPKNIRYFIRPTTERQIEVLTREFVGDPAWLTNGTLTYGRLADRDGCAISNAKGWDKMIDLRCSPTEDVMVDWSGPVEALDDVSHMAAEVANKAGISLLQVTSREEMNHLLGFKLGERCGAWCDPEQSRGTRAKSAIQTPHWCRGTRC